jgi:quinol monooxygenase YgiN
VRQATSRHYWWPATIDAPSKVHGEALVERQTYVGHGRIRNGGRKNLRDPQEWDGSIVRARMISFKVPPDRLEEVENAYLNSLVPEMEKYQGFAFALVFRNKDTNETYEVSIWEDEEALRESEKEGAVVQWKTNTLESITGSATVVENYELRLIT